MIIQKTLGRFFELPPHQANHGYLTRLMAGSFFLRPVIWLSVLQANEVWCAVFLGDRYDAGDDSKRTSTNGSLKTATMVVMAI